MNIEIVIRDSEDHIKKCYDVQQPHLTILERMDRSTYLKRVGYQYQNEIYRAIVNIPEGMNEYGQFQYQELKCNVHVSDLVKNEKRQ